MPTSKCPTAPNKARRAFLAASYVGCLATLLFAAWVFDSVASSFKNSYWGLNAAHYNRLLARLPRGIQEELENQMALLDRLTDLHPPQIQPDTGRVAPMTRVAAKTTNEHSIIRYTTDGSIPAARSPMWSEDHVISNTMVLRARTFSRGEASPTVTRTYIVGVDPAMPVLSLAIDPVHLNDRRAGILANPLKRGRRWERTALLNVLPAHDNPSMECEVKLRVHGNSSRNAARKKLRFSTPPTSGNQLHRMVSTELLRVNNWILHTPGDVTQIYRERLGNRIAREMGIPAPAATMCLLVVNGNPWGIYDLMPRVDSCLFAESTSNSVTILRGPLAKPAAAAGSTKDWLDLYQFLEEHDLNDDAGYQHVAAAIDLDSLIDFWIFMIYTADYDRPQFNMVLFRDSQRDNHWRFLAYDSDLGFNRYGVLTEHDTLGWHLRESYRPDLKPFGSPDNDVYLRSTILLRRLMARNDFRDRFRTRFEYHLGSALAPERTLSQFESILATLHPSRDLELAAFPTLTRTEAQERRDLEIERIRSFLRDRNAFMRRVLTTYFLHDPVQRSAAESTASLPRAPGPN